MALCLKSPYRSREESALYKVAHRWRAVSLGALPGFSGYHAILVFKTLRAAAAVLDESLRES